MLDAFLVLSYLIATVLFQNKNSNRNKLQTLSTWQLHLTAYLMKCKNYDASIVNAWMLETPVLYTVALYTTFGNMNSAIWAVGQ